MPGRNCAVFGCGSCRRTKGIGIWKLPLAVDERHRKWREDWLGELKKTREMDADFREQINKDRVYTCEKHFAPEDVEICKYFVVISCLCVLFSLQSQSLYALVRCDLAFTFLNSYFGDEKS